MQRPLFPIVFPILAEISIYQTFHLKTTENSYSRFVFQNIIQSINVENSTNYIKTLISNTESLYTTYSTHT